MGIEEVKKIIKENLKSYFNSEGLLTRCENEYFNCLSLNYSQLEMLFRLDEAIWAANFKVTQPMDVHSPPSPSL